MRSSSGLLRRRSTSAPSAAVGARRLRLGFARSSARAFGRRSGCTFEPEVGERADERRRRILDRHLRRSFCSAARMIWMHGSVRVSTADASMRSRGSPADGRASSRAKPSAAARSSTAGNFNAAGIASALHVRSVTACSVRSSGRHRDATVAGVARRRASLRRHRGSRRPCATADIAASPRRARRPRAACRRSATMLVLAERMPPAWRISSRPSAPSLPMPVKIDADRRLCRRRARPSGTEHRPTADGR